MRNVSINLPPTVCSNRHSSARLTLTIQLPISRDPTKAAHYALIRSIAMDYGGVSPVRAARAGLTTIWNPSAAEELGAE
jgi:hypothetical protein